MHLSHFKPFLLRVFLVFVLCIVLGPFVWCALISLQGMPEVNSSFALLLPRELHLDNITMVLSNSTVAAGFVNSLIISLLSVAVNLLISIPAGFALARVKMPLTNTFLKIMMMFIFVPILLLAVPVREMLSEFGLRNSYWTVALPMSALVMTTMTFWTFYSKFPDEMDDCSVLMGMTPIQGFFRIYLPVSGKMAAYAAVMQFVTTWNCSFIPLFMYRGPGGLVCIQESLLQFTLNPSRIFLGMVAVIITCLPCWLLYVVRYKLGRNVEGSVAEPFHNSN